ncbi:MAG: 4-phosphoerythronate dehydrogenase [Bacteroidales bacterium]
MKIVIDKDIPYIRDAFENRQDIDALYINGADITKELLIDADALIVRTRTVCNKHLLANTKVRAIATATIGYDHIDVEYCERNNIRWSNAPGCNAESVNQYVMSAISRLVLSKKISQGKFTLGIVGLGHVGTKVQRSAEVLGIDVILSDPPRAISENNPEMDRLDEIIEHADIITLHTPLTTSGEHKTFHLADRAFFNKLKKAPFIINTCRGEVLDSLALIDAIKSNKCRGAVIDCWENEPNINVDLLKLCDIASPHIAGYSKDGKAMGTTMAVQFVSKSLNLGLDEWQCQAHERPASLIIDAPRVEGANDEERAMSIILKTYEIEQDDKRLRDMPSAFEAQRSNYPIRREFRCFEISNCNSVYLRGILERLNFRINKY